MTVWTARGSRLDIEVAVALEIATLRLKSAERQCERQDALAYSAQLWRIISRFASMAPVGELGERLMASADIIAGSIDPDVFVRHNTAHAQMLGGRAATNGALRRLLDDWNRHRGATMGADFASWILDRLDDRVASLSFG
ncbi:MAG: hypothetical protein M0006_09475 [Magnetospirillum sp.]|nr:hypothetical protein [Magnetospirillum sp.]